jgi:RNA polymerase sigma-70 factor (ECF subfamily)
MQQLSPSERFVEYSRLSQGQVFGYIFALVQDLDDAQDIYQQTNLILWQKFDAFDGINFAGWACRTAQFVTLSYLRSKRRAQATFNEDILEQLTQTAAAPNEASGDRHDALQNCLKKLSRSDRKLIELFYTAGHSVKSVAERWGRSAQSVSNSLCRIRRALSDCIQRALLQEGRP